MFFQRRRLVTIFRGCHKKGNHIAVAIAEGDNFVPFHVFMPAESEVVATFLRHCRPTISVDDADVEVSWRENPQPVESKTRQVIALGAITITMCLMWFPGVVMLAS